MASDPLTNQLRPPSAATLTVRVVKSFEYRNEKNVVLHDLDLEHTSVGRLKQIVRDHIQSNPGWKPYRSAALDTLKLYTKAHGAKTTNLIINLDHDDWILDDEDATLAQIGCENETELSFFNREQYDQFKANPVIKWDP